MSDIATKSKLTIKEAADFLGYSNKSTLMKHKAEGRFSVEKDENDVLLVDKSELLRVYPRRYRAGEARLMEKDETTASKSTTMTQHQPVNDPEWTPEKSIDPNMLRWLLKERDQEIEDLKADLHEAKKDLRDKDQKIVDLADRVTQLALPAPERKLSFWERLTGVARKQQTTERRKGESADPISATN